MKAGLAVALLVWLLAPSVAWFDAGELAASATTLGVPHPTGFPLFHFGSHPLLLLPLGPLALRMHLAGALAAVAACALWWRTLAPARVGGVAWLGAMLVPLLAPSVAMHVRGAEVYAWVWLHAAVLVAAVVQLRGARRTTAIWALGGVGALVHAESAGLAACAAVWVTGIAPKGQRLRPAAMGAALAVGAAAGLAYLPLAASRMPRLSWGDVRDLDSLWAHLSAASIRHAFSDRMGTGVADAARMFAAQLWRDLGPLAFAALPGAVLALRHSRLAGWATVALIGLDIAYALVLNPMGLRDGQVGLIAEIGLALLGWVALISALRHVRSCVPARPPLAATATALILGSLIGVRVQRLLAVAPNADLRAATHLADGLFADVPPGSLLLASSDQRASACIWQQVAVGARPDSRCVPLVFTRAPRMASWLAETGSGAYFLAAGARLRRATTPRLRAAALGAWLRPAVDAGPVLWERGHSFEDAQVGDHLRPGYPWDELTPSRGAPATVADFAAARAAAHDACVRAGEGVCRSHRPATSAIGSWATLWGAWLLRKQVSEAPAYLEAAVAWAPASAPALNNLAVLRMNHGASATALALCERALTAQPDYHRAHRTAARAALRAGRSGASLRHAAAWLRHSRPGSQRRWIRGLAQEAQGQGDATLAAALAALGMDQRALP